MVWRRGGGWLPREWTKRRIAKAAMGEKKTKKQKTRLSFHWSLIKSGGDVVETQLPGLSLPFWGCLVPGRDCSWAEPQLAVWGAWSRVRARCRKSPGAKVPGAGPTGVDLGGAGEFGLLICG